MNKFSKEMLVLQKENIIYGILGLQGFFMLIFGYSIYFSTPKQTTPENQTITLIVKELPSCLSTLKGKSSPEPPMRKSTPGDPDSPTRPSPPSGTAPAEKKPATKVTPAPDESKSNEESAPNLSFLKELKKAQKTRSLSEDDGEN